MKQIIWTMQNDIPIKWKNKLNKVGVKCSHYPTICFKKLDNLEFICKDKIKNADGILLTSKIAANFFIELYPKNNFFNHINIYTISQVAYNKLINNKIPVQKIANHRTSLISGEIFVQFNNSNFEMIHLCSEITPPCNWQVLERWGITVKGLPIYKTLTDYQDKMISDINKSTSTMIVFSSPSGIIGFLDHFSTESDGLKKISKFNVAALGQSTKDKLEQYDIKNYIGTVNPNREQLMKKIFNSKFIMEGINEFTC